MSALCLLPAVSKADAVPFGAASAYNLVALGTVDSNGNTVLAGTIATNADIGGRVAAADQVLLGTTLGSALVTDPFASQATYALVSPNGLPAGQSFNINGGGNVFAPGSSANINFNNGGSLVTTGSSGINFSTLRSTLDAESVLLSGLTSNGVTGAPTPSGGNPSWLVLQGNSATLNVFTITAAQFADTNHPIDIEAPTGSTVLINVLGSNLTLGTGIYYNGVQYAGDSTNTQDILFNFASATNVAINAQFSASLLAPFAVLTGNGQMDGNFIAAQIGQTGEVHNIEFDGNLPGGSTSITVTPEPSSLVLLGTGMLSMAALFRKGFRPRA
ncbi:MAG: choice-of-anchor A family protein [Acidobacteriota bacterium]|nr:choice-of-anchor A family protein [Acidobacteriota bacterium]